MYCTKCGSGIEVDSKFCQSCGTAVMTPAPQGTFSPPVAAPMAPPMAAAVSTTALAAASSTTAPQPPPVSPLNLAGIQTQFGALRQKGSATAWFLLAGSVVVAISGFFPWVTGTINDGLGDSYSETLGMSGPGRFVFVALVVAIVAISWPVFSGGAMSRKRTIGLTVVVGVLTLLSILLSSNASHTGKTSGLSQPGPGFGAVLCWIALVAVWIGTVRVWSKGRRQEVVTS
jgi:hypothetical protein